MLSVTELLDLPNQYWIGLAPYLLYREVLERDAPTQECKYFANYLRVIGNGLTEAITKNDRFTVRTYLTRHWLLSQTMMVVADYAEQRGLVPSEFARDLLAYRLEALVQALTPLVPRLLERTAEVETELLTILDMVTIRRAKSAKNC